MVAALIAAASVAFAPTPPPSVTALIETIDLTTPVLSPDGKRVAFRQGRASLNSNRYEISWWTVAVDGSAAPVKASEGGTALWKTEGVPVVEAPIWSSDSGSFFYRALRDQQVQVWRARVDGGGARPVTQDDADVDRFFLQGADRLVYAVRATRAELLNTEQRLYDNGVLMDAFVDPAQTLFNAVEVNGRMSVERFSGRWFQRDSLAFQTPERFRTIDLNTSLLVETDAADRPGRPAPPDVFAALKVRSSAHSDHFGEARITSGGGLAHLEVQRPDGAVVSCSADICGAITPSWLAWRPGHDEVVFAGMDARHETVLATWSVGGSQRTVTRTFGQLDGGWVREPCTISENAAVCVYAAAMSPPRLERIDLASGARRVLAAPNGMEIEDKTLEARHLVWKDGAGRTFSGEYIAPAGAQRAPLFVNYYNCDGYLRGGVGDEWPFLTFAKAGIAALCINTTRDPKAELDAVADYDVALGGVTAAIDRLDHEGRIDRHRVGMGGLSFGTEVTVWVARKSNLLAAASISSVLIEPAYYWLNGVAGRDIHDGLKRAWKLGAPEDTPERWKLISPALSVEEIKTPLLMQYSEQEFRPTIEFFARLSNTRTPVEMHVFPQERHLLAQPRHRLAAYQRNVDWFRFWLQDYTDPDPEKAEQYRRWTRAKALAERRP